MEQERSSVYYYFFLFLAIFGWGLSTSFVDFALEYTTPMLFLGIRFFLAVLILSPYMWLKRFNHLLPLFKNKWAWIVGFAETVGLVFQYFGQQQGVTAGLSALLSLLFLLIVPFLSPFFLDDKLKFQHLGAVFLGLIGIMFISTEGNYRRLLGSSILGILLLLGAAFGFAFYIVTTSRLRKYEMPDLETIDLFYFVLFIVSIISLPTGLILEPFAIPSAQEYYFALFGLIIFSTLLAFFSYFVALKHVSANVASVLLLAQIFVPFPIDIFILGISYSWWIYSGMGIIVVAMIIAVLTPSDYGDGEFMSDKIEDIVV